MGCFACAIQFYDAKSPPGYGVSLTYMHQLYTLT